MSDMGDKRLLMKTDRSCQRFSHQGGGENDRTLHKRSELIFPPRLDPGTRRDKSIPSSGIGNPFRKKSGWHPPCWAATRPRGSSAEPIGSNSVGRALAYRDYWGDGPALAPGSNAM